MNIVIYARYSSHSQTEQSIEGQLQTCYEFAKNNGHIVIGEYIDRAQSGTTDSRAEFQRMIADSDKHIFEGVLVYQLDRFARNRYDSAINKAKLKKKPILPCARILKSWRFTPTTAQRGAPLSAKPFSGCWTMWSAAESTAWSSKTFPGWGGTRLTAATRSKSISRCIRFG